MRILLLALFSLFLFPKTNTAQTIDPNYIDGIVQFKLNDNSLLELDPYTNNVLALNLILSTYGVDTLFKPFKMPGTPLDKVYRIEFTNISLVNNLIADLELIPDVEFAEKSPLYKTTSTPNDLQSTQWALTKIKAPEAWDISSGSANIVIAIVDNAVMHSHEDLVGNRWVNTAEQGGLPAIDDDFNGFTDDIYGYDVANSDNNPEPPANTNNSSAFIHGTHVAGIAAAATNNGVGMASLGYNCKFMSVKCSPDNSNGQSLTKAQDGIYYAMRAGADVISMSFASPGDALVSQLIIDQAYNAGIVLIAAAGNDNTNTPYYPAYYSNVIAVGATNENDEKASFSNYGNWVDVMAPGTNIYSTLPENGNTYGNRQGTSMATPFVSGLAGLVLAQNGNLSPAQVKNKIMQGCENIDSHNSNYLGQIGAGRINALYTFSPLGVSTSAENIERTIFPNPTQAGTMVNLMWQDGIVGNVNVSILDITGKLVSSNTINTQNQIALTGTQNLNAGTYFIKLNWGENQLMEKLVVF